MRPKNRVTTAMLAFFTGFIGGHKLYLGKVGGFIGFIILFIVSLNINLPISLFIGIIQGIRLLNMSDQDFDKKYNRGQTIVRQGPLEARRDAQMRRFQQLPEENDRPWPVQKRTTPTSAVKSNAYKNSGIKKYKDFDLEDAISDFNKGLEIAPNDVAMHFNIACAYSLTEKKELAYHHLSKAVSLGLQEVERIMSHDDLAFVRIQPEFDAFRSSGFRVTDLKASKDSKGTLKKDKPIIEKVAMPDTMDDTLLAQLNKLSALRQKGILSEDEFSFERKKLLRQ